MWGRGEVDVGRRVGGGGRGGGVGIRLNLPHSYAQLTPYMGSSATRPLFLDMLYYRNINIMFTLIVFVWRDAQHPEIYADILVSDKTMIASM